MKRGLLPLSVTALALTLSLSTAPVTQAAPAGGEDASARGWSVTWDDFRRGFDTTGSDAKWQLTPTGDLPAGDGTPTTSAAGLRVAASGTNPATGQPAFTYTTEPEPAGAGAYDHLKWYAMANHTSTAGFTGFDTTPGQVLSCEAGNYSARTFGTGNHPFGADVSDPRTDLRLAAGTMSMYDLESSLVFDFFVTDRKIYAFYERLPTPGASYASFSYAVPVADRTPDQKHKLSVAYDRTGGAAVWKIDGAQVFKVDRPGHRLADRTHMVLDHGGREEDVIPRQLSCGLGLFNLLDAEGGNGRGLVKVSSEPAYDPDRGAPYEQTYVDPASLRQNRLWGQGARIDVGRIGVSSLPR
ncbi:DUF6081 family protein [Streptomyces sp. NPDC006487]|uniref:DUF6081 family protein n=1 Tax=Streptomyces sp. NPDC006487 TaxID=3364748 RepID=UPI0036BCD61A